MHAVVLNIGFGLQSELRPLGEDRASDRVGGRVDGVCRAQDLGAEVRPSEVPGAPLGEEVIDRRALGDVLAAHLHEERIEHIESARGMRNLGAIESAAELDQVARLLGVVPEGSQAHGVHPKPLASVSGIQGAATGKDLVPLEAEVVLKLVCGHRHLVRFQERRLGGECIVVLIHKHVGVDFRSIDGALPRDHNALFSQVLADEILDLLRHSMRLDEHERGIEHDILLIQRREGDEPVEACPCIHVLKLVEDGTLLAIFDGHLRVQRPCLDHRLRYASGEHPFAKDVVWGSDAQPIVALCEAFEGRCRSMHAVIADVRRHLEPELLPLRTDLPAQGVCRCLCRICRTQHLAAEVCPR
mmetsp:Transcript_56798/g.183991  ORF Transcript_56798/g.183991 Transcript_56798/m.183991 type:complete len:357 (+) Transcript_56798:1380-2450(+)